LNSEELIVKGLEAHTKMKKCLEHIAAELLEVTEAWAERCIVDLDMYGKPIGFASELADMVILINQAERIGGVDLDEALRKKMDWLNGNKIL